MPYATEHKGMCQLIEWCAGRWARLKRLSVEERRDIFGVILSLEHLAIVFFWITIMPMAEVLQQSANAAICWPHFELCHWTQPWVRGHLFKILCGYGFLACVSAFLFWRQSRKRSGSALWPRAVLLMLNFLKAVLILQDLRLGGNFHYIPFFVSCSFSLLPKPENFIRWFLVLTYFFAGLLKLNSLWLSGFLAGRVWLPQAMMAAGAWYVVVLELIMIWFLLMSRRNLFVFVLSQLFLFHMLSIPSVLWFYPFVMASMLSIFLLFPVSTYRLSLTEISGLVVYSLLQLPLHLLSGDHSVTGQGRLWALNMYDGATDCNPIIIERFRFDDHSQLLRLNFDIALTIHARVKCDPLLYLQMGRGACRKLEVDKSFEDLDISLVSRSLNWKHFQNLVNVKNFCASKKSYRHFLANSWIAASDVQSSESSVVLDPTPLAHRWQHDSAPASVQIVSSPVKLSDNSVLLLEGPGKFVKRLSTGEIKWQIEIADPGVGFFPQATILNSAIVLALQNGFLIKVDLLSGQLRWAIRAGPSIAQPPQWQGLIAQVEVPIPPLTQRDPILWRSVTIHLTDGVVRESR